MKSSTTSSELLEGAFMLSAAALLSKLIGTLQKIPLQNLGGDAVFGIYNTVNPIYSLLLTVAMLGLPTGISKFVAESAAAGDSATARTVLRLGALLSGAAGLVLGAAAYAGAPLIALWVGSSPIVPAIRAASLAMAVVPAMSALRGYFQGLQNMAPTALSQIIEQSARVAVMVGLLLYLTGAGAGGGKIAAGAMLGSAGGGLAGLGVMLVFWRRHRKSAEELRPVEPKTAGNGEPAGPADGGTAAAVPGLSEPQRREAEAALAEAAAGAERLPRAGASGLLRAMLLYSIPVMLGSLAVPLVNLVDVFTMPRLLAEGRSEAEAMAQFGIYNRGLPLVQLVTMLATSLSVLFIPFMAESKYRGDLEEIRTRTRLSLRWFWLLGLAAAAGLAVLAAPINRALYGDGSGTAVIALLGLTAAAGTVSIIAAALLQGLGQVRAPALHLLASAALKAALNLLLVPQQGIVGAAVAGVAAQVLAAALNVLLLRKAAGLRLRPADVLLRPAGLAAGLGLAAAAAAYGGGAALAAAGVGGRLGALAETLLGVAAGVAAFAVLAVRLRLISESELRRLPGFGPKLADRFGRLMR
ncbi:polysaccharide biosynthesis protein [Paenibacillus glufosinatiresistens]|uniref:polysaccharide biosynthesis protein n=1 Tax=Paenibacillus glufosinatiresistens TaxID=3070657 RepID=UPI00286D7F25|nr:polysaccharide biosynthesis protein [Paenibacillus sp. YX.27]